MLEKDGLTFIANCDSCPETFDTEEYEFIDAVAKMRAEGWKVFRTSKEWCHECPDCSDAGNDFEEID